MHRDGRFDVELAYFAPGRGHRSFEEIDAPMRLIPRHHRFRLDLPGRTRRLRRAYADRPPDVMQTWLLEGNIFGLLAARAWPETALVLSNRGSWNELDYRVHARLQRWFIGRADHAISNSPGGAEALAAMGMDPERISVIPNGIPAERVEVEEDREALRSRLGWVADIVLSVGRPHDPQAWTQKDFTGLLTAMGRLRAVRPNATLALVGLTHEDIDAAGYSIPDWVLPLGPTERAPDYMNAADLVVISSRMEGHSNVAGEALMLGIPVVTTDCGGHTEVVQAAQGRVVPVGDPAALAAAMGEVLASPPDPEAVRRRGHELLSIERLGARTTAVYEEVMERKRGRYRGAPCAE
jgi:glycosyltransferase involved in cell wall biosynthesis